MPSPRLRLAAALQKREPVNGSYGFPLGESIMTLDTVLFRASIQVNSLSVDGNFWNELVRYPALYVKSGLIALNRKISTGRTLLIPDLNDQR